ncbi:TPA: hypothetical protein QIZ45_002202 [Klebsiella pneumoniae subsp. pneumoniae]|uniref:hypothetical protein n=1 Tax=Klebsiella quasipneumoniae TaxID=1463165 RepID=UPI001C2CB30D|nr:hypothetical protein [Klebsiella quasipneumoniae]HDU3660296.1 hypothetical protein [Klebsiella pneumoniae subsp. pneumoniae]MBV0644567.1 hypothetical protein [Klebsiella quasipneumoniae]MCJ5171032.1 hypothetical protein [Klebsiella quasipneumoniae]MCJ5225202.1 hypothetical protein [Klebsiella quasipneumoniae]HBQ8779984.1 hypothetical protein [Klebsiella quasipneumoniae]
MSIENCKFEGYATAVIIDKSISKHIKIKNTIAKNCGIGFLEYDNEKHLQGITSMPDDVTLRVLEDTFQYLLQTIKKKQFTTKKTRKRIIMTSNFYLQMKKYLPEKEILILTEKKIQQYL